MKKYISLNEPNSFYYNDAELLNVSTTEKNMIWTSNGIAITPKNSLSIYNRNMRTEDIIITFENYKIERVMKYGSKQYSLSGKILTGLPDTEFSENEIEEFLNEIKGYKLWAANYISVEGKISGDRIIFEADMDFERSPYSFVLFVISCDKFIVEWDEYSDNH